MHYRRPFRGAAVGVVAVFAMLLAACGGSDSPAAGDGPRGTIEETDNVEVDADEMDPDATLTWSYTVPSRALDPARAASAFDATYLRPAYDTLIRRAPDQKLEPGLAESWEFVDDSTLELVLREGVVFHDGADFDAEAVKANLERTQTIEGGTQAGLLSPLTGVEVVDAKTVRLTLGEGAATMPGVLTSYPGMMVSPAAIEDGVDLNETAVGTGPYKLVHYDPQSEVRYERFEDSWEPGEAGAAELRIIVQSDPAQRLNQMRTGQADMTLLDAGVVDSARNEGFQLQAESLNNAWYMAINNARPAFSSVEARQAVNLAIDRQALVDAIDFGYGTPGVQVIPEGQLGHNDDLKPEFDVARAGELIAEAGVEDETVRILIQSIPVYQTFQQAVGEMLTTAGFTVDLVTVETAQIASELLKGEWDLYIGNWPGAADPLLSYKSLIGEGAQTNPGTLPAEVKDLMAKAGNETDAAAREGILDDLAKAVHDNALVAILSYPDRTTASTEEVVNFKGNVHSLPDFRGAGKRAQ